MQGRGCRVAGFLGFRVSGSSLGFRASVFLDSSGPEDQSVRSFSPKRELGLEVCSSLLRFQYCLHREGPNLSQ